MKRVSSQVWGFKPLPAVAKAAFLLCASLMCFSKGYAQCSAPTVTTPVTYCQGATATALTATGSNLYWNPGTTTTVEVGGTAFLAATTFIDAQYGPSTNYTSISTAKPNVILVSTDYTIPAWQGVTGLVISLYNSSNTLLASSPVYTYTNNTSSGVKRICTFNYTIATPGTYYFRASAGYGNIGGDNPTYPITESSGALRITGNDAGGYRCFNRVRFSHRTAPTPSTATVGTTNYTVTQTIGTCTSTPATISVVVNGAPATPTFSSGASSTRCNAAVAVAYTATSSGATMSYSLDATSLAAGNTIISSTGAVTYTAAWTGTSTITATATRCGSTATATHTAVTNAVPTASGTSTATCVGGSTGTITVSGSGGTTPYTYSLNAGTYQSSATFTALAAATYTVNVKSAAGCIGSASVTVNPFANSTESQTAAGTDSWIGHVYDGTAFASYIGKYAELDTFSQAFGGSTVCFGVTANSISKTIYTESFSVRYRMASTKNGLYIADLGSDDGSRLMVDGTMVYNNWADQSFSTRANVLFGLNGSSSLLYEFYENSGGNQVQFRNLTLLLANTLSANTTQSVCLGGTGAAISGDVFTALPTGISLSGTGYQWTYSTTLGGTRTAITGATGATFTPATNTAPFNAAGTYYVYRNAVLSSTNNVSPNPYVATNESNAAVITVSTPPSATISYTGSPYCANTGTAAVTQTGTAGGTYSSAAGLSIDAGMGTVNLAASTPGTYTVTYTIAASSGCAAFSTTASITVTGAPYATGTYPGNPYCTNGGVAIPSGSTSGGGTLTASPSGLSFNSSNGVVNLGTSAPGTYTVTLTIPASGGCPVLTSSSSITINAAPSATIAYAGSPYCTNSGTASVTQTGTAGGTYSSTTGLSINASTGAVNVAASTPGAYTVTYDIGAANGCAAFSTTASIQIFSIAGNDINYTNGTSGTVCSSVGEGSSATLTAPAGTQFVKVGFASYGTPGGVCPTYVINNACHAATSQTVAQNYLLGNNAGTIPATNAVFTDPCSGTVKTFSVQASYAQPICAGSTPAAIIGSTPTGGNGTYTYAWQTSTTSATTGFAAAPGTNNTKDYAPGALSQTTWFRRIVASGGCSGTSVVVQVTVTPATTASILYTGSPYCSSSGTATVTHSGTTGGTYSGTTGLVINSTTGAVTLGTSTAGTHTVTYTVPALGGCPAFTTIASIVITAQPAATGGYANPAYCTSGGNAMPYGSSNATGTLSASPAGIYIDANFTNYGIVNLGASTPGTYTVIYTVPAGGGCAQYSTSWPITINAAPSAAISYTGTPYCSSGGTAAVTHTGTAGGTYSSTTGLSINSSTGAINLSASTAGTYTVTYSLAAAGGCPAFSTTAGITITAAPSATIAYTGSPYCSSSGTATVTRTGAAGGAYSSAAGLSINAITGAVNLGASTPGTYTVTYAVPAAAGCAQFSTTAPITVTVQPNATGSYASPYCANGGSAMPTGTSNAIGTFSAIPSGIFVDAGFTTYGVINLAASAPGTYNVVYTIPAGGGCAQYTLSNTVVINPAPSATIGYPGNPFCTSSGAVAVSQTGTTGGTYSSTAGLSINATTGAVTPGTSTPGTYSVTYTVAAAGGCAQYQTTTTVTITAAPAASIVYTGTPYNNYGGTASVTQTGASGGTYSSTAGLYLDTFTGAINLDSSSLGTYTVTYTVPASGGCAQYSTTTLVTIGAKYHYRSIVSGAWNVAGTWEWSSNGGAAWTAAATPPSSTSDTVTVVNGHTVTVPADIGPSQLTVNGLLDPASAVSVLGSGMLMGSGTVKATMPAAFAAQYAIANKDLSAMTVDFAATSAQSISGLAYYNVIVSNTGGEVSTDGNSIVAGTLMVNAGAVLNGGAYTIGGAGTLTGSGKVKVVAAGATSGDFNAQFSIATKTLTNLEVEYAGIAPQYISGYTYSRITMNNSAGASLAAATTVDNVLSLTNGIIDLGANHLTLGVASTVAGTPSASAMLATSGAGEVRKRMSALGSFTFPVGDNLGTAEYSPATIVKTSGVFPANGYISMRVVNAKHPSNGSVTSYLNRYWVYTQSGITGNYTGTYYYVPADVVGSESLMYSSRNRPGIDPLWTLMSAANAAGDYIASASTNVNAEYTGTDRSGGIYLYRSRATGNWNSSSVWQYSLNGGTTWVNAGTYPATAYDTVYVMSPHTVAGNLSISPKILAVNSGGILNPSAATIYSGTGTLSGTGTVYVTRTVSGASLATQYTLANRITDSLTVRYVANAAQAISPAMYGNLIIAGTNTKTIAAATTAATGDITVETGATLVNSGTLTIAGAISNSGTLTTSAGTIEMNGTAAQTVPAAAFTGNLVKNLTVANTSGVTLGGALNTSAIVKVTSGVLHSDGNLTLLSSASGTALVDGSGAGDITGDVTMQRYLTSRFGYKYISSPFSTATINELADDLDLAESFPTVYRYDENQAATGWQQYTTGTDTMVVGAGYAANFGTSTTAYTFNISGVVNNGPATFSGLTNHNHTYTQGFNLIGNPYPSPIDWNSVAGWSRTNVDNAVYYFDRGNTNRYTGSYSSYINGVSSNGIANNIIPAMQGFFVHVSNGIYPVTAGMTVNNAARVNNHTATFHKRTGNDMPLVRLRARFDDEDTLADATVVYLDDHATMRYEQDMDALKMLNTDERVPNLYSYSADAQKLSISAMASPGDTQRFIPLGIELERSGTVHFEMATMDHWPAGLNVFLADRKTGAVQDLRTQPTYTAPLDTGRHENRFFLVFSRTANVHLPGTEDELMAYASGQDVFVYLPGGEGEINILNTLGQVVQRRQVWGTGYHRFHIDAPTGVYIATLATPATRQSKKVFIGTP